MDIIEMTCIWLFLLVTYIVGAVSQIYTVKGSSVQLNCPHRATVSNALTWDYSRVYPTTTWSPYSANDVLNTMVSAYPRFNVTGDFSRGEYNLVITNVQEDDEGYYKCYLSGTSTETVQQLVIVDRPLVTVNNITLTDDTSPMVMTCKADGNPDTYTYYEWTHASLQGKLIRILTGNNDGTLTLPNVDRTQRYMNAGIYTCIVGSGIPDTGTKRTGSGVLTVNAPPVFALYNSWTYKGEISKTVDISVDVYSVPPPSNFEWYREETQVSGSGYKTSSLQAVVKVMFHGQIVNVSGYRATLTIVDVQESDFTSYKIRVINGRGSTEHAIQLFSISNCAGASEMENDTLNGAAVGISVVAVISLIINMVFVYKCVAEKRKPKQLHKGQPGSDTKDLERYVNIPKKGGENSFVDNLKYESLGEKDKPNVYEDLGKDKRGENSSVDNVKYESLGARDKPNVYEDIRKSKAGTQSSLYSNTLV